MRPLLPLALLLACSCDPDAGIGPHYVRGTGGADAGAIASGIGGEAAATGGSDAGAGGSNSGASLSAGGVVPEQLDAGARGGTTGPGAGGNVQTELATGGAGWPAMTGGDREASPGAGGANAGGSAVVDAGSGDQCATPNPDNVHGPGHLPTSNVSPFECEQKEYPGADVPTLPCERIACGFNARYLCTLQSSLSGLQVWYPEPIADRNCVWAGASSCRTSEFPVCELVVYCCER